MARETAANSSYPESVRKYERDRSNERRQQVEHDPSLLERRREQSRQSYLRRRESILEKKRAKYAADPEPFKAASAQYRKDHPDRVIASARKYESSNREQRNAQARDRRAANPERSREINRRSYHKHRDKRVNEQRQKFRADPDKGRRQCRESYHRRKASDPEKVRLQLLSSCRRHQARKRGALVGDLKAVAAFYERVRLAARVICYWCGKSIPASDRSVDHIRPLAKGGAHHLWNLVPAHKRCNTSKGAKMPEHFCGQFELAFPIG